MRILLIDDDPIIGDGLAFSLKSHHHAVDWFQTGDDGYNALANAPYDVVILDLGLPGMDGLEVLKKWREEKNDVPILILTARDAIEKRVEGLNAGADDYLTKPFSLDEIVARLNALVRRKNGNFSDSIEYGNLVLNVSQQTASLNGKPLDLTHREYVLLDLFLNRPGQILTRSLIEDKLYNWDQEIESNAVEVHIHHLRKKISPKFIITKRGLGYQLGEKP